MRTKVENITELKPVTDLAANPGAETPGTRISAARAQQILTSNGLQVTRDQAAAITEFLYTLAKLTTQ